jgi:hypothetical protein
MSVLLQILAYGAFPGFVSLPISDCCKLKCPKTPANTLLHCPHLPREVPMEQGHTRKLAKTTSYPLHSGAHTLWSTLSIPPLTPPQTVRHGKRPGFRKASNALEGKDHDSLRGLPAPALDILAAAPTTIITPVDGDQTPFSQAFEVNDTTTLGSLGHPATLGDRYINKLKTFCEGIKPKVHATLILLRFSWGILTKGLRAVFGSKL